MARVEGRIQSLELEIRQDGNRLCFVDRNNSDRPGIAPTIRIRPCEILRVARLSRPSRHWHLAGRRLCLRLPPASIALKGLISCSNYLAAAHGFVHCKPANTAIEAPVSPR
jgi:hypothetical protein